MVRGLAEGFLSSHSISFLLIPLPSWVVALPFQAHTNYGTWSIDFEDKPEKCLSEFHISESESIMFVLIFSNTQLISYIQTIKLS